MAKNRKSRGLTDQVVQGEAIIERLAAVEVPPELSPYYKGFIEAQRAYGKSVEYVADAEASRDAALDAVGAADGVLDRHLFTLADRVVGASLGSRKNPFA